MVEDNFTSRAKIFRENPWILWSRGHSDGHSILIYEFIKCTSCDTFNKVVWRNWRCENDGRCNEWDVLRKDSIWSHSKNMDRDGIFYRIEWQVKFSDWFVMSDEMRWCWWQTVLRDFSRMSRSCRLKVGDCTDSDSLDHLGKYQTCLKKNSRDPEFLQSHINDNSSEIFALGSNISSMMMHNNIKQSFRVPKGSWKFI
jgi:hypothetical protein